MTSAFNAVATDEQAIVRAEQEAEARVGVALGLAFEAGVRRALGVLSVLMVLIVLAVGAGAWFLKDALDGNAELTYRITVIEGALENLSDRSITCTPDPNGSASFHCE